MLGFYNYTVFPTYFGLASSVFGIFFAMTGKPYAALLCLMLSGAIDAFDGKIARTKQRTDEEKRFGIQIDSLSDLVCFGVLPAVIGYSVGMRRLGSVWILVCFILAALIRLAYFNVREEERQSATEEVRKTYEGLPVTSVALILPLVFCFHVFFKRLFPVIYGAALLLIAAAFVSHIKVKKPSFSGIIVMIVVGLAEVMLLLALHKAYG